MCLYIYIYIYIFDIGMQIHILYTIYVNLSRVFDRCTLTFIWGFELLWRASISIWYRYAVSYFVYYMYICHMCSINVRWHLFEASEYSDLCISLLDIGVQFHIVYTIYVYLLRVFTKFTLTFIWGFERFWHVYISIWYRCAISYFVYYVCI